MEEKLSLEREAKEKEYEE